MLRPSRPSPRLRSHVAGLLLTAAGLFAPVGASAADAPLRTIGVTPAGAATASQQPVAISPDGKLVLANDLTSYGHPQPILRDVAAGTTTRLLADGDTPISASLDLSRFVYSTERKVSAKDVDATADLYVFDRASGQSTLISQDPVTGKLGDPADVEDFTDVLLTADGKAAVFQSTETTYNAVPGGPVKEVNRWWRFDLTAGQLSQVSSWGNATPDWVRQHSVDDAGLVTVSTAGINVGTRTLPLPFDVASEVATVEVSPDGSTVLFDRPARNSTLTLVNTATGAVSTINLPTSVPRASHPVWGALNGGAGAVLSYYVDRGAGPRTVVATVSRTGVVTQAGGDIKTTDASQLSAVSRNLQFAATHLHLAQLGTTALPGGEPTPTGPAPDALKYVYVADTYCNKLFGISTWVRARATLVNLAIGTDTRLPKSSEWKVYDTVTKKVINAFTLAPGKSRDLTVPRTGGWSYDVKVTLSDNAVITGTGKVDPHPTPACMGVPL